MRARTGIGGLCWQVDTEDGFDDGGGRFVCSDVRPGAVFAIPQKGVAFFTSFKVLPTLRVSSHDRAQPRRYASLRAAPLSVANGLERVLARHAR